jgi:hypothetical protein
MCVTQLSPARAQLQTTNDGRFPAAGQVGFAVMTLQSQACAAAVLHVVQFSSRKRPVAHVAWDLCTRAVLGPATISSQRLIQ